MSPEPLKDSVNLVSETSLSAVLRTLHIVEIVQEILESLHPRVLTSTDYLDFAITWKKTFHRTALTSRAFLEPSLDILWRNIHSIYPLLKLLPLEDFQHRNGEYILNRLRPDTTSNNWHRIQSYARRVKTFYHVPTIIYTAELPFHTCNTIPYYFPSLLPNLSTLHINSFDPKSDPILFTIISSPLRHVEICNIKTQDQNLVDSLLICLWEKSLNIEHLTLGGNFPSLCPQLAKHLTGLISLDLMQLVLDEGIFQPTMQKVANLPLLKKLMLNLGGGIGHQLPETAWSII
ncbi:hypothetical protein BDN72DRAFT_247298 [Pluteus cervinus]|uniref:Uncharacterized protein n=1 Tax=Pluteus cervinus TaxID=181527 RepID=A0ACD3B648_9AGAR|nr:hypothetical protein BDN72DRAFT_247298 [Pluteus cervinus]